MKSADLIFMEASWVAASCLDSFYFEIFPVRLTNPAPESVIHEYADYRTLFSDANGRKAHPSPVTPLPGYYEIYR